MDDDSNELLRAAFDAYLARLHDDGLEPSENYLSYDFDHVDKFQWQCLGQELVKDELNELTNRLNHWHGLLRRWHAWNLIVSAYDTNEAWELRREFLDALAHYCLLQPSAIRDTITFVATNSLHQVRLASVVGYPDFLVGDPKHPKDRPELLSRSRKEKRLTDLISPWPESGAFLNLLRKINTPEYQRETSDYRNLSSHSIAPRLGIGITRAVVRSVEQAAQMLEQPNGTYTLTPIPDKMSVKYGFGGTEPLDMEKIRVANLEQYRLARECYSKYRELLYVGMASMPVVEPPSSVGIPSA